MTEDHILSVLFVRGARSRILGDNLFSDPAWDILLELYAAKLGGRILTMQELAQATRAPASTVRRWVAVLHVRGLTTSATSANESAPSHISLTDEGASKMEQLVDEWGSAFVSMR